MSFAQGSLRYLAILEPNMIMPDILERAYDGLEVVNETHRTTAVLNILAAVPRPLVSEKIWFGGQKHLLPLLELCIPGIDLVRTRLLSNVPSYPFIYRRMTRLKLYMLQCSL